MNSVPLIPKAQTPKKKADTKTGFCTSLRLESDKVVRDLLGTIDLAATRALLKHKKSYTIIPLHLDMIVDASNRGIITRDFLIIAVDAKWTMQASYVVTDIPASQEERNEYKKSCDDVMKEAVRQNADKFYAQSVKLKVEDLPHNVPINYKLELNGTATTAADDV